MKRIAVIDLGTNTFNLLIVEKTRAGFNEVFGTKVGVGLGLGGINENKIANQAMLRAIETLKKFKRLIEQYQAETVLAFGTSAIRNAENKERLLNRIKREVNMDVTVISGRREAELIYQGVSYGYAFDQPSLIMDIGGGSTEFIWANKQDVKKTASFEIGVARIFQLFQFSDPLSPEDCQVIENYLEEATIPFFDAVEAGVLVGASGSFETFYELVRNADYPRHQFVTLSAEEMEKSIALVISSTQAQRDSNPRIIPIRKKMAPIAAVKIRWIIRKLNIRKIIISPYALKEGVIKSLT